jgi:hypothetical protein
MDLKEDELLMLRKLLKKFSKLDLELNPLLLDYILIFNF